MYFKAVVTNFSSTIHRFLSSPFENKMIPQRLGKIETIASEILLFITLQKIKNYLKE
jgi:hypothetical protein